MLDTPATSRPYPEALKQRFSPIAKPLMQAHVLLPRLRSAVGIAHQDAEQATSTAGYAISCLSTVSY